MLVHTASEPIMRDSCFGYQGVLAACTARPNSTTDIA
jgi:hypothetical protein